MGAVLRPPMGLHGLRRLGSARLRPRRTGSAVAVPPLRGRLQLARACLVGLCAVSTMLVLQLTVIGSLQHGSSQQRLFDSFRAQLVAGTAPIGPTDIDGAELAVGAPVSYLEVPRIDLRQVVVEGTSGSALLSGPGHRRDTPLPGQRGVSIIAGRRAAFGGPFARITELEAGDRIRTTTGQGTFDYRVTGLRRAGDPLPPPPEAGDGRLVLATADGSPYLPEGVVRVDAEMEEAAAVAPRRLVSAPALPPAEQLLGADTTRMWLLVLWLQVLLAIGLTATWSWHRWGRAQAWVTFVPPLLLGSAYAAHGVTALLPNLL